MDLGQMNGFPSFLPPSLTQERWKQRGLRVTVAARWSHQSSLDSIDGAVASVG